MESTRTSVPGCRSRRGGERLETHLAVTDERRGAGVLPPCSWCATAGRWEARCPSPSIADHGHVGRRATPGVAVRAGRPKGLVASRGRRAATSRGRWAAGEHHGRQSEGCWRSAAADGDAVVARGRGLPSPWPEEARCLHGRRRPAAPRWPWRVPDPKIWM